MTMSTLVAIRARRGSPLTRHNPYCPSRGIIDLQRAATLGSELYGRRQAMATSRTRGTLKTREAFRAAVRARARSRTDAQETPLPRPSDDPTILEEQLQEGLEDTLSGQRPCLGDFDLDQWDRKASAKTEEGDGGEASSSGLTRASGVPFPAFKGCSDARPRTV
jgi:hypothetical protein